MYGHLPNLNTLRIFEAAARNLSFTKAAEELHISQSAVSHQVRNLEAQMDVVLFVRMTRALALTDQGKALFAVVYSVFDELGEGVSRIRGQDRPPKLSVSLSYPLGVKWLAPHLSRFARQFPGLQVRLNYSRHLADFARQDCDIAIQWAADPLASVDRGSLVCEYLLPAELVPVCSRSLDLSGWPKKKSPTVARRPSSKIDHSLVHLDGYEEWQAWFDAAGLSTLPPQRGLVVDDPLVMIHSVLAGDAVALMRMPLIIEELTKGELRVVSPIATERNFAYWLIYPERILRRPVVKAFRDYLLDQAAKDRGRLAPFRQKSELFAGP